MIDTFCEIICGHESMTHEYGHLKVLWPPDPHIAAAPTRSTTSPTTSSWRSRRRGPRSRRWGTPSNREWVQTAGRRLGAKRCCTTEKPPQRTWPSVLRFWMKWAPATLFYPLGATSHLPEQPWVVWRESKSFPIVVATVLFFAALPPSHSSSGTSLILFAEVNYWVAEQLARRTGRREFRICELLLN